MPSSQTPGVEVRLPKQIAEDLADAYDLCVRADPRCYRVLAESIRKALKDSDQ